MNGELTIINNAIDSITKRVLIFFLICKDKKGESKTFHLLANASYQGRYYQPAITAEAMYDGNIKATQKGRWLDIVKKLGSNIVSNKPKQEQKINVDAKAANAQ